MNLLLAFAPFLAFFVISHVASISAGLVAGAAIALCLVIRDAMTGRGVKVLEIGTTILFGALALYASRDQPAWSIAHVRFLVDAGLLGIVLMSMLISMPLTLQYARERVAPELWAHPEFVKKNYVITGVWAAAFAVMMAADLVMEVRPGLGVAVTVAAIWGAMKMTEKLSIPISQGI